MPKRHSATDQLERNPPAKTGPLTAETYESAARSWIKAIGGCVMLDPRAVEDHKAWAAWHQFFATIKHPSRRTMGRIVKRTWHHDDKFAVPTRYPWDLTGEMPFVPSQNFYPSGGTDER